MKKVLMVQIVILGLVILAGALLKNNLTADAYRTVHKLLGLLAVVAGMVAIIAAFKYKAGTYVKALLVVALVATILAGVNGKSAVSSKGNYAKAFNTMRGLAVVALASSVGSYYIVAAKSRSVKKPQATTTNSQD